MQTEGATLRKPLDELLSAERGVAGDHLGVREIEAYRAQTATADDEARWRDHLVGCRECRDKLLLEPGLSAPASKVTDENVIDIGVVSAWRSMERRIRYDRWRVPIAAAAMLAVALPTSVAIHRQHLLDQLVQPQANVLIYEPGGTVRGLPSTEEVTPETVNVPPGAASWTVVLPAEPGDFTDHEIEIVDSNGESLWRSGGFEVERYTVTLGLSRHFLDPGDYVLELSGVREDGTREPLDSFRIRLVYL